MEIHFAKALHQMQRSLVSQVIEYIIKWCSPLMIHSL